MESTTRGRCLWNTTSDANRLGASASWNTSCNGKTTFLQALSDTLGDDYSMAAPADLLMVKSGDQHPTALADLHGKRFISCIEAGEGRRMAEALVKSLTGGDKIRARRMREDFWEFRPSHSIWLAANHKPVIRGRDVGIWRRIKLIPFGASIPDGQQDPELPSILRAEAPGILAWMVRGCLEWQRIGLQAPEPVKRATAEYRDEMDALGEFIAECCIEGNAVETPSSELYAAYGRWCQRSGERQMSRMAFGNALTERGLERVKHGTMYWCGIEVRAGM